MSKLTKLIILLLIGCSPYKVSDVPFSTCTKMCMPKKKWNDKSSEYEWIKYERCLHDCNEKVDGEYDKDILRPKA